MSDDNHIEARLFRLEEETAALSHDLAALERRLSEQLPRTSLLSDSILIRSLAVWGHNFLGRLLVAIPLAFLTALMWFLLLREAINP